MAVTLYALRTHFKFHGGIYVFLAILLPLGFLAFKKRELSIASQGWPSLDATIIDSSLAKETNFTKRGMSYAAINGSLTLSYIVAGRTSETYHGVHGGIALWSHYQTDLAKGQHLTIRYCPTDPREIALDGL